MKVITMIAAVLVSAGVTFAGGIPQPDPCKEVKKEPVRCVCAPCPEKGPVDCPPPKVVYKPVVHEVIKIVEPEPKGQWFASINYFNFEGTTKDGVGAGVAWQFPQSKVIINGQLMRMRMGTMVAPGYVEYEDCWKEGRCHKDMYYNPGHVEDDTTGVSINVLIPFGK
jgi:hypothetical protein